MTEEEKIFAGYIFNNRAPELVAMKHKAHNACLRFNQMDEYDPLRQPIIKEFIGSIGTVYYFQGPIQFNYGCHTFIGENFFANFNLTVMDDARIYIGDNVCFGPNVSLMATNHPLLPQERLGLDNEGRMTMAEYAEDIHIGHNVWLACNVTVLGGASSPRTSPTAIWPTAIPAAPCAGSRNRTAKYAACCRKTGNISNIILNCNNT